MMPIDFPPPEIIHALEEQLGMDFVHFTVTMEGIVEGIFANGEDNQVVSFEAKREFINTFQMPPFESIIAELNEEALEDMRKMFQAILAEIEGMKEGERVEFTESNEPPKFDDTWYCP